MESTSHSQESIDELTNYMKSIGGSVVINVHSVVHATHTTLQYQGINNIHKMWSLNSLIECRAQN